jgi:site-specific DNA-methyltransferase (cytosine-N4-specific)
MTRPTSSPSEGLRHALDQFRCADWTFADAKTNAGVHSIHPYPAKFIPQIPRNLIKLFHPLVGGLVLDPFCGCGTTLVECQAVGIPSFGIDLNPIAVLVSRVKTDPPACELAGIAVRVTEKAASSVNGKPPDIPRVDHWFSPGAITALTKLTRELADLPDRVVQDALRVALSRIIVRVSRQDSDTRYAAVDRSMEEEDVYAMFLNSARALDDAFKAEFSDLFRQRATSTVLAKDILGVDPDDLPTQFGLIITSPPYPNAYEYWLYHKYRMYWLGEDPIAVRTAEIGARPHYFRRNPATEDDFRDQMAHCFGLFRKITLPSAFVCMIVGRSVIRGKVVDNAALLRAAAEDRGFQHLASATREIPSTRKTFNPSHGTISSETLLVFQRKESNNGRR